jgi:hypothetical protein
MPPAPAVASDTDQSSRHHRRHKHHGPSSLKFVVVHATVRTILPEDTRGLPHQRFVVQTSDAGMPKLLEVDHDTHFGTRVESLRVGEKLTIRGVLYHDRHKDGIHWTHHRDRNGDAGYIQDDQGHIYQ